MGNEHSSLIETAAQTANESFTTASTHLCGSLNDTLEQTPDRKKRPTSPLVPSELICSSKPFLKRSFSTGSLVSHSTYNTESNNEPIRSNSNPMSALFARALISEPPNTMTPSQMTAREKQLLQAQERARQNISVSQFMKSINLWGLNSDAPKGQNTKSRSYPPNQLHENRARLDNGKELAIKGKHTVTIGLSLSRRHTIGHPDTVTRQTAFDFNELQDRAYKYVSSTDASGWRAGGGERGGTEVEEAHKIASPDTVHIPIIQIDAESPAAVDSIIASLARGEIFIPHMSVLPEALSVNGVSPPDLIVRFGCERNDDLPPDEWPNWSLEFMHNQLYEYFLPLGARWTKRPFQITLAHKVRWRTVKHMNKYFAHAERVISAWREKGPQYLNPQLSYIEGGATPEEVARPHGIYLLRDGRPTNYFCPNLEPPYTTKMTRSLLLNVLDKSWDRKRRDWSSEPQQSLIAPSLLLGAMCGCDTTPVAFMPNQMEKQPAVVEKKVETNTPPRSKKKPPKRDNSQTKEAVRYSPASTESPVVSEAGVSDIPERLSDIGVNDKEQPPKPEEKPKSKEPPKPEEDYKKSDSDNDTDIVTDLPHTQPFTDLLSVGESQTTDPTSNVASFRLAKEREQRKQREIEMLRERKKMEEIEAAIKRKREKENEAANQAKIEQQKAEQMKQEQEKQKLEQKQKFEQIQQKQQFEKEEKQKKKDDRTPSPRTTQKKKALLSPPPIRTNPEQIENFFPTNFFNDNNSSPVINHSPKPNASPKTNYSPKTNHSPKTNTILHTQQQFTQSQYSWSPQRTNRLIRSNSADTLEYSLDSFSISQHQIADSQSVTTLNTTTGQSLLSYVTRSTINDSYYEPIPTDEELFAIGWAKALDVKSGSYYYFTLDRSRIVWDNPMRR